MLRHLSRWDVNNRETGRKVRVTERGVFLRTLILAPGRFILANTEELHEKISELQSRITDLEDALGVSHAAHSSHPHPLLRPDLLALKTPLGAELVGRGASAQSPKQGQSPEPQEEVLESFGTLTIGEGGVSTFYGSTVGSEFLFEDEEDELGRASASDAHSRRTDWLPDQLSHLAHTFPFATLTSDVETVKYQLRTFLPSVEVAWHLSQSYSTNAAWMYNPLNRQTFWNDVFSPIYDMAHATPITSHALSVAFGVLALGVLVDLDRSPYDPEAEKYHFLSRAALAIESCLENTTIQAIQSLILMAYFNQMTDKKTGPALTWSLNGLAMKLAQSIGLHRDWEKWGLPMHEVAIRRTVMWECICFDSWSAFGFGRPPSQAMNFVDCKQTPDPQIPDDPCASFDPLKYRFTEILLDVINASFGATPPTYDQILRLDRQLRDYYIPPLFQVAGINEDGKPRPQLPPNPPLGLALQSHAVAMLRENALLYMHRSFFAKALGEHPDDPFKSRYAASVLACHRSACAIIVLVRKLHYLEPRIVLRFWYFWVHSFTASVVLASIVTKTPHSNLAPSSMAHVDLACDLFKQVAAGSRPATTLPILLKLRQKAHEVYVEWLNSSQTPTGKGTTPPRETKDNLDPMLSGQTRLVSRKKRPVRTDMTGASETDARDEWLPDALGDVHPSLVDHLRSFNEPQSAYTGSAFQPPSPETRMRSHSLHQPSVHQDTPGITSSTISTSSGFSQQMSSSGWTTPNASTSYSLNPSLQSQSHANIGSLDSAQGYDARHWDGGRQDAPHTPTAYPQQQFHPTSQEPAGYSIPQYIQTPSQPYSYTLPQASLPPPQRTVPSQTQPRSMQGQSPSHQYIPTTSYQPMAAVQQSGLPGLHTAGMPVHADPMGGLMHTGGVGSLEQSWRSFLSGVDFPTSPIPGAQPLP
ncbi:hypothetical protein FRC04_005502 [Tulasnella sp. 424]|nr:hypothetical protein FRC04_005502 [Tulasnella sp. 424]